MFAGVSIATRSKPGRRSVFTGVSSAARTVPPRYDARVPRPGRYKRSPSDSRIQWKKPEKKRRPRRRRLKVVERIPVIGSGGNVYEVKIMENGKARCPCKGFRYRSECRHLLDPDVRDVILQNAPARRSYREVAMLASCLATALLPYCVRVDIMGSLRRRKKDVKDIDLIFVPGVWPVARVVALFRSFGAPVHHGETMGAIMTPQGIPAQLWAVENAEVWGAAQLHFTGPRDYNISLRIRANRRGWKLSQHGLVDRATERLIAGRTEEEVLAALEMPWLEPALREHHRKAKVLQPGKKGRYRYPGKGF